MVESTSGKGILSFSSSDSSFVSESELASALTDKGISVEQQEVILSTVAQEPVSSVSPERLSQFLLDQGLSQEQVDIVLADIAFSDYSERLSQVLLGSGVSPEVTAGILLNMEGSSGFSTTDVASNPVTAFNDYMLYDFLDALAYLGSSPIFVIGISLIVAVLSIEITYSSIKRTVKSDSWVVTDQDTQEMINSVNESLSKYYPRLE